MGCSTLPRYSTYLPTESWVKGHGLLIRQCHPYHHPVVCLEGWVPLIFFRSDWVSSMTQTRASNDYRMVNTVQFESLYSLYLQDLTAFIHRRLRAEQPDGPVRRMDESSGQLPCCLPSSPALKHNPNLVPFMCWDPASCCLYPLPYMCWASV